MVLKEYTPNRKEAVAKFFRDIFAEMGWNAQEVDNLDDPEATFHLPDGVLLLVLEENRVIGSGGIVPLGNREGVIKRFYVGENHRGTGIAQVLLKALIEKAKSMQLSKLVLDVLKTNKRGIRFYEKSGFSRFDPPKNEEWSESKFPEAFYYYCKEVL